ncbi:ATP-dependent DNA helicase PIF1 [Colletotrichum fructicola Nara gc5]|uniref:ATP-dependent DNA helicase n=1 Tax=Colletotrichum fructicola (strain Nara gc5) TaxID=1213859 RepID=L2FF31_COLFN|nr:ATP-dependent DNA helicase PIF1 [Colletotrichum fructicola]KAF4473735.1 ATP-dependent DNA helicase PIF1 [Colletotrichum fructicola Nara gc5]KAF4881056.1 ATP-dependent DNA helicase PIF1 [Colletotrichum fructicola]
MDLAMQGHNLFITGSGGCGKSVLVRALYRTLAARYQVMNKMVHLLAPTGQASINIGGRTTYNYAGWTPEDAKKPLDGPGSVIKKARGQRIFRRYCNTQVLIIDEISMVENQFFQRLSRVMSVIRNDPRPFGGVQIIVCGKGMNNLNDQWICPEGHDRAFKAQDKWAFKAPEWERCNFKCVRLTKVHRQSDEAFINVLQKCRLGQHLDDASVNLLLSHDTETENGTELKSTRKQVDLRNLEEFIKIPGDVRQYKAADACTRAKGETEEPLERLEEHRYPRKLHLKVNTPVILLANADLDRGLCNGRQGVVVGFVPSDTIQEPRPPSPKNYEDDDDGYRAATERYNRIVDHLNRARCEKDRFPEVKFANGEQRVIGPDCAVIGYGDQSPYSYLSRTQIPLTQGWAMTIHKSQSLSLDRVNVDLSHIFEHGQAYVALGRARNFRGLKVEGADAPRLGALFRLDDAVRAFMRSIEANNMGNQLADAEEAARALSVE